jgi:hypothetical protein
MITELEKSIYNTYLKHMRMSQNKPYRLRKDFDKFEQNPNYPKIRKISNIFKSCPHISMEDYFIAPYKVYTLEDEDMVYTLDFYASMKALGCYKQYMVIKELCDPDEEHQLDFIKRSFQFILKFCMEQKITFDQYLTYQKGFTYEWMKHYAEKKISLLCLLEYDFIYDMIMGIEEEHRSLLLGDLEERFYKIKGDYLNSSRARIIVKKAIKIVKKNTSLEDKEK